MSTIASVGRNNQRALRRMECHIRRNTLRYYALRGLTIPKGGMPKTFPRGELLNEMERNGRVERTYSFNPEKVLAWLIRNNLIEMERTNDTTLSFKVLNAKVTGLSAKEFDK